MKKLGNPSEPGFNLEFDSESGVCNTFFDEQLSLSKKGTHAEGSCGNGGDAKVKVSTTSGDLRILEY